MQETAIALNTHVLVVILFLILFTAKTVLLLFNKHKRLEKVKRYTKALDAVFGSLILVSGVYLILLFKDVPVWLIVKVVLVLLAIPLGIIGLKRHNKLLTLVAWAVFLYVYGLAETNSLTLAKPNSTLVADNPSTSNNSKEILESVKEVQLDNAKAIFNQLCSACHGINGDIDTGGTSNLTISNLDLKERINVIKQGSGLMPGFQKQLTDQEINALAAYTLTLKN
jgi:uncharacterized membrane protein SirB2